MARRERIKPRAEVVADELREFVKVHRLVPGDRLPSEAELEEMLGVGRSSVREGIQLLESLGVIEVEHGKGTFVASAIGGGLHRAIEWVYPSEDRARLISDLTEARVVIEGMQARLAAERASDLEIADLLEASDLSDIEVEGLTAKAAEAAGHEYHHMIGRAAHNDVLLILSNAICALHSSITGELERPVDHFTVALENHDKITQTIARRDADGAESAMRNHLNHNREMLEVWIETSPEEAQSPRAGSLASSDVVSPDESVSIDTRSIDE